MTKHINIDQIAHPFLLDRRGELSDSPPPKIIIHCSAEPPGRTTNAATINDWHKADYGGIGYHYVITGAGVVEGGRPLTARGAHTSGHNDSIGICMIGGLDNQWQPSVKHYTEAQWQALEGLVLALHARFPEARIAGHNEFAARACPCFQVPDWWEDVRLNQPVASDPITAHSPTTASLPDKLLINGTTYVRAPA